MRSIFCLLAVGLSSIAVLSQDAKPDYLAMKKVFDSASEKRKNAFLKECDAKIADAKAEIADIEKQLKRTSATSKAGKDLTAKKSRQSQLLEKHEAEKSESMKNNFGLQIDQLKVGDFGKLEEAPSVAPALRVISVLDGKNFIGAHGRIYFWVEMTTTGMTDEAVVKITDYIHVDGTRQYLTTGGNKKTVLHFKVMRFVKAPPKPDSGSTQLSSSPPTVKPMEKKTLPYPGVANEVAPRPREYDPNLQPNSKIVPQQLASAKLTVPVVAGKTPQLVVNYEAVEPVSREAVDMRANGEIFIIEVATAFKTEGVPVNGWVYGRPTEGSARGKLLVVRQEFVK